MEKGERSSVIQGRIIRSRKVQFERFFKESKIFCNSEMAPKMIERYCRMADSAKGLLSRAVDSFGLSARGYNKIIKIAWTIADMSGDEIISEGHIAEALQYRFNDTEVL